MRKMIYTSLILAFISTAYLFFPHYIWADISEQGNGTTAAIKASDADFKSPQADIIELFTSQGCYSCPPAEALMRKLSQSPDIVTFEYHVDYWNNLVHGAAGKWKDPFSSPEATIRQGDYNQQIRHKNRSYTPQAVINGTFEMVGSHENKIHQKLNRKDNQHFTLMPIMSDPQKLDITISGTVPKNAKMTYVQFIKRHVTQVISGENKGKTLASYNIVTKWHPIRLFKTGKTSIQYNLSQKLPAGQGCFVYLSHPKTMEIYGGSFCKKR